MNTPASDEAARAARRYMVMNAVRVLSILGVIAGIAIARDVIALPYPLGAALALISMVAFFFAPPVLAKRWKASDRENPQ